MAFYKKTKCRERLITSDLGETIKYNTAILPADSPKIVTESGSPPKNEIYF